ncbi:MAG TPA: transporter [Gemmatimonadales bacterium]
MGRRSALLCLLLLIPWRIVAPQGHLRDRLRDLFTFGDCGRPLCLDGSVSAANGHGDHFLPDLAVGNAAVIGFLTDAIALNVASVPITASASGATYKFVGGLPVKTSESSGPIFAERAQTLGRGRLFLGAHLAGAQLKTIRGTPLDNLLLNFTHQDVGTAGLGDPVLENDVLQMHLSLQVSLTVASLFATYGISDAVDVSVAIPLVHTSLQGRSEAQVLPFGSTAVHFFTGTSSDPGLRASAATFGSSTGIGDIAVRLKANLHTDQRYAVSLMGDARLPTGSEEELTGAGAFAFRGFAIGSARLGDFSPHVNLGYLLRAGHRRNDALLATAGFDQPVASWATLAVDVVSEWQTGRNALSLPGTVTYQFPFIRTVEPTNIPASRDHRVHASLGFKFRASQKTTLITNALLPVKRGGLQPYVMWTVGADFNF